MFISNERESMHSSTPAPPMSPRISWNKIQVLRRASKALHGWESGYICGPMLPWRSSLPVCSGSVSPIADPLPGVLCPQTCAWGALPPDLCLSCSFTSFWEAPNSHLISKLVPDPPSEMAPPTPHLRALPYTPSCHIPVFTTPGIRSHSFTGLFHISLTP